MTAGLPQSQEAAGSLYIINLRSSTTPMALEVPDVPELSGFAVFRSRRLEDGRDRFRLHLGYFDSQEQAEALLPLLRERYPAAWVALAPREGMGSLDDTSVAHFKLIREKKAAKSAIAPAAQVRRAVEPADSAATDTFLKPAEVLSLLETGSPIAAQPVVAQEEKPAATDITAAPQKFAVQLIWSTQRPEPSKLPRPVIFDAYSLYTVTVQRGPDKWYGLRLGFFNDAVSARQLALYVRSDFKTVSVVPVSERECARAEECVKAAAEKVAARRAAKAAVKAAAKLAPPQPQPKPEPKPKHTNDIIAAKDSIKQVLEQLSEDGFDSVNDSGVRHLSISIVKPKNTAADKLLQNRWSRLRQSASGKH